MRCARGCPSGRRSASPCPQPWQGGGGSLPEYEYLVDSSILIGRVRRQEPPRIILNELAENACALSVLTRVEVLAGADPGGDQWARELADSFPSLPVDQATADLAAELGWRHRMNLAGKTVDLCIAATAIRHGLVLVTLNTRDFSIPELTLYPVPTP